MSRNLLILSLFFLSVLKVSAQCTPDNSITKPGFYPSLLPDAAVGVAYNQVLQFKIIKDTTVIVFGNPTAATIDSATIVKVNGMPDGLTFQLNKPRKTYTPAEVGCALISGTPTKAGTFKLQIVLKIYAKLGILAVAQADTIKNFSIVVTGTSGTQEIISNSKIVYPNPLTSDKLTINSNTVLSGTLMSIYNCQGQFIAAQKLEGHESSISFNYPKGMYWISFDDGNFTRRVKVVKE